MRPDPLPTPTGGVPRRTVLRGTGALAAGAALSPRVFGAPAPGRARGDDELKVALVGCGGRGGGAAAQALSTAGPVRLWAMADAFEDRLEGTRKGLAEQFGDRVEVPEERRFTGFDAYRRAIDSGVDVVILATPPGFRPAHFEYAVERDKHVFMEKPVATDAPGVRQVLAAAEASRAKGLRVGVGLQRHHDVRYQETVRRLQEGALGRLVFLRCYWNSAGVWVNPRQPGQSEMEYQMRNWYYFNWLCGDHIVEQHIHNLDVCNWIQGGPPVSAQGVGGRQVRTAEKFGEIYDHHMVEFTYADGTKMLSECRHQPHTWGSVSEHAHGALGSCNVGAGRMRLFEGEGWRHRGEVANPYQVEHDVLFAAIREGREHHEAEYGATSTMTAILGRMATYSGQELSFADALASERSIHPERLAWDAPPPTLPDEHGRYAIPTPGVTEVL